MILNNFGHPPLRTGPAAVGTLTRLCTQNKLDTRWEIIQDSRPWGWIFVGKPLNAISDPK
jgi:hypothetical protein